ncbi:MAG: type VI-A CRISPR-associated RNA-guided ribonuclease Cas13a [Desulfovibrionaceae bacterium]
MKLTKVHNIYHKKVLSPNNIGTLLYSNGKPSDNSKVTRDIINKRFNETLESRIYKEFLRLNSDAKLSQIKATESIILKHPEYKDLYHFIHELYSYTPNTNWRIGELQKIDVPDYSNERETKHTFQIGKKITNKKDETRTEVINILFQYKITEHQHFYQEKLEDKLSYQSPSFIELLNNFIQEAKEQKIKDSNTARTLQTYKDLQNAFAQYKEKKIAKILKSIENNKVPVIIHTDTNSMNHETKNFKYFKKLFKTLVSGAEKNSSENTLQNTLDEYAEKIDLKKHYQDLLSAVSRWKEKQKRNKNTKNTKDKPITLRAELKASLNTIKTHAGNNKVCSQQELRNREEYIYFEEFIKYIELITSKNKQESKGKKSQEKGLLNDYIQKALFTDFARFKKEIDSRFMNRFTAFIIDYGKRLYYRYPNSERNSASKLSFSTEDMEYIKAKESLTRKLATLISFSAHAFSHLLDFDQENQQDILGAQNTKTYLNSYKLNKKNINYFFDTDTIVTEENSDLLKTFIITLSQAIYDLRNGVVHFKDIEITSSVKKEEELLNYEAIKNYFERQHSSLHQAIIEQFLSNNLEKYFTVNNIEVYLSTYTPSLPKKIIPFAPTIKRIHVKGKNLSNSNKGKLDKKYNYWIHNEKDLVYTNQDTGGKQEKTYRSTRNFLLKELYYHCFLPEFLNDKKLFHAAISHAKERKEKFGKEFTLSNTPQENTSSAGTSYKDFPNIQPTQAIEEYIALLHKLSLDRENIQRFEKDSQQATAHYVNEFIEDIFLEGFVAWLNSKKNLSFLKNEPTTMNKTPELLQKDKTKYKTYYKIK